MRRRVHTLLLIPGCTALRDPVTVPCVINWEMQRVLEHIKMYSNLHSCRDSIGQYFIIIAGPPRAPLPRQTCCCSMIYHTGFQKRLLHQLSFGFSM